jgi:hypothetical protein
MSTDPLKIVARKFRESDFAGAIAKVEALLAKAPDDHFKGLIGAKFTNKSAKVLAEINGFIRKCQRQFDLQAVYLEMNGFSLNNKRWFFDLFGYTTYVAKPSAVSWLADWQSEDCPAVELTGLEKVQKDFAWYHDNEQWKDKQLKKQHELAESLVLAKFAALIDAALKSGKLAKPIPVLATAHDFDTVARFVPAGVVAGESRAAKTADEKWYKLILDDDDSPANAFLADDEELHGRDPDDLESGKLIKKWNAKSSLRSTVRKHDGRPDDLLGNALDLPVFSKRLQAALREANVAEGDIQYLPIRVFTSKRKLLTGFAVANITATVPALDIEKSFMVQIDERKIDPRTKRPKVKSVGRATLLGDRLKGHDIIRLAEFPLNIYVSQRFVDVIKKSRFTGAYFSPVELS